jgi:hypothetical protein
MPDEDTEQVYFRARQAGRKTVSGIVAEPLDFTSRARAIVVQKTPAQSNQKRE